MSSSSYPAIIDMARKIGAEVVGPNADKVDREARFPTESFAALKAAGMLGASVPSELGGLGASLTELVMVCEILGRHCSSTAMVFAMHHIQVLSIVRHAMDSAYFRGYLREVAEKQLLIASVTSEVGVGGEMRSSICALEAEGESFQVIKDATTISYGAQADDLLITARRSASAARNDQVLILVRKSEYTLQQKSSWDTLGMRGTCSPSFLLTSRGAMEQVLAQPFADISAQTVVPVSHLLWSGFWLGLAAAAVNKARTFVRAQARSRPGSVPPTALRLAETSTKLQALRTTVESLLSEYERLTADPKQPAEELGTVGYALKINNLKLTMSQSLPEIVTEALIICGIQAYKNDSPYAMGRHLRDSHSAALQVGNDRILATNSGMLLILKDEWSLIKN